MSTEEELTNTIRKVIAATGETQLQVGKVLGVALPSASRRFTGHVRWTLEDVEKLARHWNVQPIDLLQGHLHAVNAIFSAPRQRVSNQAAS